LEGHVAYVGEVENAYRTLLGKPERKRPLVIPRHRWEGNIKMDLKEIGRKRIHLAQDGVQWRAVVNTVVNLRVS